MTWGLRYQWLRRLPLIGNSPSAGCAGAARSRTSSPCASDKERVHARTTVPPTLPAGFRDANGSDLVEIARASSARDTPLTRSRAVPCCGPGPLIFVVVVVPDSLPTLAERSPGTREYFFTAVCAPAVPELGAKRLSMVASPVISPPNKRPAMRVRAIRLLSSE